MAVAVDAERLVAEVEAEMDACERRRRGMVRLLREIERRAELARRQSTHHLVRVREAAVIRREVLDSVAVNLREVIQ